jgi:hypothetical protein
MVGRQGQNGMASNIGGTFMADERYTEYGKQAEHDKKGNDAPEVEGHRLLLNEDADADFGEEGKAARNEYVDADGEGKAGKAG